MKFTTKLLMVLTAVVLVLVSDAFFVGGVYMLNNNAIPVAFMSWMLSAFVFVVFAKSYISEFAPTYDYFERKFG